MLQQPPYDDCGGVSTTNDARLAARSRRDRGSTGLRSWSSSTNHLGRPMELQVSGRSDRDRVVSAFDEDPALLVSPRGVR